MSDLDKIISKQRDRTIATILGVKERECDKHLPPEVSKRLRKVVLDELNAFTTFVVDLLNEQQGGELVVINELWWEKLNEIHAKVVNDA